MPSSPPPPDDAACGTGTRCMRERVRALGASVKIEREPEMGIRVCIEMTFKEDREPAEGKVRVLLVEDHAAVREALACHFEQGRSSQNLGNEHVTGSEHPGLA